MQNYSKIIQNLSNCFSICFESPKPCKDTVNDGATQPDKIYIKPQEEALLVTKKPIKPCVSHALPPNRSHKKKEKKKPTNLDDVLSLVGSFGFYQQMQFLLVGFLAILPSMVAYSYVFVSATPKFACKTVLETQVINTDSSKLSLKLNDPSAQYETSDKYLNLEKSEYLIETRRYIRLIDERQIQNASETINYDCKCIIDAQQVYARLNITQK